jgi:DNA-binding transcriptional regulator GbsR (MarR family)
LPEFSARQRYAEEAAISLIGLGLPPAYGKLLGWLLICDPPQQTSADISAALGLSKGSVSTGMRMLETAGLVRRVPVPGQRGHAYEMVPDAFVTISKSDSSRVFRDLMQRGLDLVGGEDAPGAERLRDARDFYAFVEREFPLLLARFQRSKEAKADG